MSKKVVITGGSGFIGSALSWRLLDKGYEVVSLDLHPPATSRVKYVEADLSKGIPEHALLAKPTYVVNLAGTPIYGRWTNDYMESIYHSRIEGTKNLVEFMANPLYRPEALISASATGFYGDSGTINVDERSDGGDGFLAQVASDWEESAKAAEKLGIRTTIVRNGHVIGNGGLIAAIRPLMKIKLIPQTGKPQACLPWIHQEDLVNLYHLIMEEPRAPGVVNAVSPHITTVGEFYRTLATLSSSMLIKIPESLVEFGLKNLAKEMAFSQCVRSEAVSSRYTFKYPTINSALNEVLGR